MGSTICQLVQYWGQANSVFGARWFTFLARANEFFPPEIKHFLQVVTLLKKWYQKCPKIVCFSMFCGVTICGFFLTLKMKKFFCQKINNLSAVELVFRPGWCLTGSKIDKKWSKMWSKMYQKGIVFGSK